MNTIVLLTSLIKLLGLHNTIKCDINEPINSFYGISIIQHYSFGKSDLRSIRKSVWRRRKLRSYPLTQRRFHVPANVLTHDLAVKPRPIMLPTLTNWCKLCEKQRAILEKAPDFQNSKDSFYHVEPNIETTESIATNRRQYKLQRSGSNAGIHELVLASGGPKGELIHRTWLLLDQNHQLLFRLGGILSPDEMKWVLNTIKETNRQLSSQTLNTYMDYVIQLLEKEKNILERAIKDEDLMHKNMKQATCSLKNIATIKRAIKILKLKSRKS